VNYILDTNAVSALMKGDPKILGRLRQLEKQRVSIPEPVFAELAYGIERLPKSKRKQSLRETLELIREEIASASWTNEVSERFGSIKAGLERRGVRIEDFDAAIAAHAAAVGAVLVTANLEHMTRISELTVEDWAKAPISSE
jgi:tRNA(fMet)-specific endonuclease VapC